jgi:hypothetical protein
MQPTALPALLVVCSARQVRGHCHSQRAMQPYCPVLPERHRRHVHLPSRPRATTVRRTVQHLSEGEMVRFTPTERADLAAAQSVAVTALHMVDSSEDLAGAQFARASLGPAVGSCTE